VISDNAIAALVLPVAKALRRDQAQAEDWAKLKMGVRSSDVE
jgi:hypothetical protein